MLPSTSAAKLSLSGHSRLKGKTAAGWANVKGNELYLSSVVLKPSFLAVSMSLSDLACNVSERLK